MIHPHTALCSVGPELGYGVVATRRIPRGTVTWAQDPLDVVLTPEAIRGLGPAYAGLVSHYGFRDQPGNVVLCWDLGRFLNHSCQPSCGGTDYRFEVALRDILPGEELTNDYATLRLRPDESFRCGCAARACRRLITPAQPAASAAALRRQLAAAVAEIPSQPQPLLELIQPADLQRALADLGLGVGSSCSRTA